MIRELPVSRSTQHFSAKVSQFSRSGKGFGKNDENRCKIQQSSHCPQGLNLRKFVSRPYFQLKSFPNYYVMVSRIKFIYMFGNFRSLPPDEYNSVTIIVLMLLMAL